MNEFCMGDLISPRTWVGPTEDLKIRFNLLVDTFHFTIGLGVIGDREGEVIIQEFPKLLGKGGGKLWTTIRDDLVI